MKRIKLILKKFWPVIAILGLWFVFAKPYFIDGLVPFPSGYLVDFFQPWSYLHGMPVKNNAMPDVITQIYPWKVATIDSWQQMQVPRWNPYQFAGNPHLANVQSAVFSPFNLLFLALPFIDGWSMLVLFQPLLAGLFMYLFLRSLRKSTSPLTTRTAALVGGLAFMFCGFIVAWMAYGTLGYAILYLPLILYGIEKWFQKPGILPFAIVSLSIPASIFSGHFQTSTYMLLAAFAYSMWKFCISDKERKEIARLKNLATLGFGAAIGLLLSLPQIFPAIQFYNQSIRSDLFGKGGEVIPWNYLITFISPDFFGNPVTRNDWFGHYAEWAGFVGVVPILLAIIALVNIRNSKHVQFWGVFGLIALLFAYSQTIVNGLTMLKIPVLSTSAASRIIVLVSFSIAVLSAFGLDTVRGYWNGSGQKIRVGWLAACFLTFILVVWGMLIFGNVFFVSDATPEQIQVAWSNFRLPSVLIVLTFSIILAVKMATAKKLFAKYAVTLGLFALIILAALDVFRFANKWMPFDPREYVYPSHTTIEYLQDFAGSHRVFGNFSNPVFGTFGLYGLEGYDPLYITRYGELVRAMDTGKKEVPERSVVTIPKHGKYTQQMFDLMGVKYLAHAKADGREVWAYPFWEYDDHYGVAVYGDDNYEVYENKKVYPRAFILYDYLVETNDQEILDAMFTEQVDLRHLVVLEEDPSISVDEKCLSTEYESTYDLFMYTANEVQVRIWSDCEGVLLLTDAYYPGWSVFVNDKKAKILRADYAFRAVAIPAGESVVKFVYEDWRF